jgi:hypothetical protein
LTIILFTAEAPTSLGSRLDYLDYRDVPIIPPGKNEHRTNEVNRIPGSFNVHFLYNLIGRLQPLIGSQLFYMTNIKQGRIRDHHANLVPKNQYDCKIDKGVLYKQCSNGSQVLKN